MAVMGSAGRKSAQLKHDLNPKDSSVHLNQRFKLQQRQSAQIGIEYIMITSLLLVALAVVFVSSVSIYTQTVNTAKADAAVSALANAAEHASALGEGTTLFVTVEFPPDVESASISGHEILVKLGVLGGTTDFYETTKAALSAGSLPATQGFHEFRVEVADGIVIFTEA